MLPKNTKNSFPPVAIILTAVILIAAVGLGVKQMLAKPMQASKSTEQQAQQTAPQLTQSEIQALVTKVSAHIEVKTGETPTIATVQNADILRAQNPTFYKDAQIGDKLLIWSDKAVLYSPTKDILLSVLPISLPQVATATPASAATSTAPAVEQAVIEVRNGGGIAGMGKAMAAKITSAGLKVSRTTDAKDKTVYTKTILIKLSDKPLPQTLQKLQKAVGAQISQLPAAEGGVAADFLIIVGTDFKP